MAEDPNAPWNRRCAHLHRRPQAGDLVDVLVPRVRDFTEPDRWGRYNSRDLPYDGERGWAEYENKVYRVARSWTLEEAERLEQDLGTDMDTHMVILEGPISRNSLHERRRYENIRLALDLYTSEHERCLDPEMRTASSSDHDSIAKSLGYAAEDWARDLRASDESPVWSLVVGIISPADAGTRMATIESADAAGRSDSVGPADAGARADTIEPAPEAPVPQANAVPALQAATGGCNRNAPATIDRFLYLEMD
jgi:hypothetical protein